MLSFMPLGGTDARELKGANHPIEFGTWTAAEVWYRRASLRLPSESEWEYACRAGSIGKWRFGDDGPRLREYAEFCGNSDDHTALVGTKKPNNWGLNDMHGNVWEWCMDVKGAYDHTPTDGAANDPGGSGRRVFRGGCWMDTGRSCYSGYRFWDLPSARYNRLGFRPVAVLP